MCSQNGNHEMFIKTKTRFDKIKEIKQNSRSAENEFEKNQLELLSVDVQKLKEQKSVTLKFSYKS